MSAGFRRLVLIVLATWAVAACSTLHVDPPRKDPALYGTPPWTP